MGPFNTSPVNLIVTPAATVMVVKLKMLSPAGLSGGVNVFGSKTYVPGVLKVSAPSAPVEPLLKVCPKAVPHARTAISQQRIDFEAQLAFMVVSLFPPAEPALFSCLAKCSSGWR